MRISKKTKKKEFAKLEIAQAQGKKLHNKREDIKLKETKRELNRKMKSK